MGKKKISWKFLFEENGIKSIKTQKSENKQTKQKISLPDL